MTALKQYTRLESLGLWRADQKAQRREVAVCFGDATLIIRDTANRPLTHWSLPAIERLNPNEVPALFAPDDSGDETLEIDDELMIEAIEKVRKALAKRRPKPGRLRGAGLSFSIAAVLALGVLWLPTALRTHTLSAVSKASRASIGATLLGHVQRLTGPVCRSPRGVQALERLKARALGADSDVRVLIVPEGIATTLALPGGIILMNRALVEDYEDPGVPSGFLIAAELARQSDDPLGHLMKTSGIRATFQLLTTGDMSSATLRDYAEIAVTDKTPPVSTDSLIKAFAEADVSTKPFAFALDITGERTLDLIEADPVDPAQVPLILSDGDWVALQGICGN